MPVKPRPAVDLLGRARILLIAAGLLAAAPLGSVALDVSLRAGRPGTEASRLAHAARLSHLAVFPSGHPLRTPELRVPFLDLRFMPGLPAVSGEGGVPPRRDPDPSDRRTRP